MTGHSLQKKKFDEQQITWDVPGRYQEMLVEERAGFLLGATSSFLFFPFLLLQKDHHAPIFAPQIAHPLIFHRFHYPDGLLVRVVDAKHDQRRYYGRVGSEGPRWTGVRRGVVGVWEEGVEEGGVEENKTTVIHIYISVVYLLLSALGRRGALAALLDPGARDAGRQRTGGTHHVREGAERRRVHLRGKYGGKGRVVG